MNVYELKKNVSKTEPYFFSRSTMSFFGDTMSNFRVKSGIVNVEGEDVPVWVLYRKFAKNEYLLNNPYYFRKDNFKRL